MTNLYKETIECLLENRKTIKDITFAMIFGTRIPVANFIEIAKRTNYDAGYGGTEVEESLVIGGEDFWLERHEYDGREWWEYKTMPKYGVKCVEIESVLMRDWYCLRGEEYDDFNGDFGKYVPKEKE